ncbi:MAG: 30S ribosomal protein S16, partial [Verrucomicrobiae bacterium]|nr:30S ribosomal protein S16 [Verrucomicrobiae bacterium]
MAVAIRLTRIGGRNDPCYRVVIAPKRGPRDGRFVEQIGTYDPRKKEKNVVLNLARVDYWLRCGAQPTETVASLIRRARREAKAQEAAASAPA